MGSNGAGKSTLLRLISGVYRPDNGYVTVDEIPVYESDLAKTLFVLVPDELFFLPGATMKTMSVFYSEIYPDFSFERYNSLMAAFDLPAKSGVGTFSKGMRRQGAAILALSCCTKYLFLDETFDGLDPVKRNMLKKMFREEVSERGATIVLASHSLRELDDTCNQLALLHKGGLMFESEINNMQTTFFKVQVGMTSEFSQETFADADMVNFEKHGSVASIILRGDKNTALEKIRAKNPVIMDVLPLSLEEVFTYEMETLGYAIPELLS
jgi:ABC-2 type transport system ATP-binding protein